MYMYIFNIFKQWINNQIQQSKAQIKNSDLTIKFPNKQWFHNQNVKLKTMIKQSKFQNKNNDLTIKTQN